MPRFTPSDEVLETLHSREFSGAARVVIDGEPVLDTSAGKTRPADSGSIAPSTRFGVASITKMFTAATIASLATEGSCDLDDCIINRIPDVGLPIDGAVTINDLLAHRSGMGDYIDDDAILPFEGMPIEELTTVESFLPYVQKASAVKRGTFHYSSAGFIVLGLLIERLTGESFPEAVTGRVIEPAGLISTGFGRTDDPAPDFAWGLLDDGSDNVAHIPPVGGPDGGIVTNVPDLERFFSWLRSDRSSMAELCRTFWEPCSRFDEKEGYGRGFDVLSAAGQTWVGHTGSDPGVSARAMFATELNCSVIVLCNRRSIAFKVFRLIMASLLA